MPAPPEDTEKPACRPTTRRNVGVTKLRDLKPELSRFGG